MKNNFLLNLAFLNWFFEEDGDLGKNGRDTFEFSVQFFFFQINIIYSKCEIDE